MPFGTPPSSLGMKTSASSIPTEEDMALVFSARHPECGAEHTDSSSDYSNTSSSPVVERSRPMATAATVGLVTDKDGKVGGYALAGGASGCRARSSD
jgi:hypothetical protein